MTKLYLSTFMKIKSDINVDTHTSLPLPIKTGWVGGYHIELSIVLVYIQVILKSLRYKLDWTL